VTAGSPQADHLRRQALEGQVIGGRVAGEHLGGYGSAPAGHPVPGLRATGGGSGKVGGSSVR
jgi:hypothetical protein